MFVSLVCMSCLSYRRVMDSRSLMAASEFLHLSADAGGGLDGCRIASLVLSEVWTSMTSILWKDVPTVFVDV